MDKFRRKFGGSTAFPQNSGEHPKFGGKVASAFIFMIQFVCLIIQIVKAEAQAEFEKLIKIKVHVYKTKTMWLN